MLPSSAAAIVTELGTAMLRRIGMRMFVIVAMLVAVAGCGTGSAYFSGPSGVCSSLHPDTVTARRAVALPRPGLPPIDVADHSAMDARAVLADFCVIEAHHETLSGAWSCPADFGLSYVGAFVESDRTLATYNWAASGCQRLTLNIRRGPSASTYLVAAASSAAPHMEADFRRVLHDADVVPP